MYKQIISLLTTIFLSFTSIEIGLGNLNNGSIQEAKLQTVSSAVLESSSRVNINKLQTLAERKIVSAASAEKTANVTVNSVSTKKTSVSNKSAANTAPANNTVPASKTASASKTAATNKTSAASNTAATDNITKTQVPAASTVPLGTAAIDMNNINRGIIGVKYTHSSGEKIKVIVSKSGSKYTYNLNSLSGFEYFPLQMGNGTYTVAIYKNISGTSYSTIKSYTFNVSLTSSAIVYLNSIQNIKWTSTINAVVKAKSLSSGKGTTEAKVKAIYEYVITNIKYDRNKVNTLSYSYIPNVSTTFSTKKGICYDFASTFAAMLRGISVPTKLVMGNSSNVNGYHAWNEVLINGKWVIIDTSYDSQLKQAGRSCTMIKSSASYSKSKEY